MSYVLKWFAYIENPDNKAELAAFLSHQLMLKSASVHPNKELILAGGFNDIIESWSSTGHDIQLLMATHKEADTRLVLHAFDAKNSGFLNTIVNSRDTDVLVMLVHFKNKLSPNVWMHACRNIKRQENLCS